MSVLDDLHPERVRWPAGWAWAPGPVCPDDQVYAPDEWDGVEVVPADAYRALWDRCQKAEAELLDLQVPLKLRLAAAEELAGLGRDLLNTSGAAEFASKNGQNLSPVERDLLRRDRQAFRAALAAFNDTKGEG